MPGEVVERGGQTADFSSRAHLRPRGPLAGLQIARGIGQLRKRTADARGNPPGQRQAEQHSQSCGEQSQRANMADQRGQIALRAADQQRAENLAAAPFQRLRDKFFRAAAVGRCNCSRLCVLAAQERFHNRRKRFGLRDRSLEPVERIGDESRFQAGVEQGAHAFGNSHGAQEFTIEAPAADHVEILLAHAHRAHGQQAQFDAGGQLHAAEEIAPWLAPLGSGRPPSRCGSPKQAAQCEEEIMRACRRRRISRKSRWFRLARPRASFA